MSGQIITEETTVIIPIQGQDPIVYSPELRKGLKEIIIKALNNRKKNACVFFSCKPLCYIGEGSYQFKGNWLDMTDVPILMKALKKRNVLNCSKENYNTIDIGGKNYYSFVLEHVGEDGLSDMEIFLFNRLVNGTTFLFLKEENRNALGKYMGAK